MPNKAKKAVKKKVSKKSVKKAVKKPVKKAAKKPVKKAVKKTVKKTVKKSVKKAVKKSVKKAVKKTVKKSAKKAEKKSTVTPKSERTKVDMTYATVKKSKIHGNGVFAKRDIPKGTRIIEYVGDKITKAESDHRADKVLKKHAKDGSGAVYIFTLNSRHDIDGNVSWNPARYINHACETNCESDIISGHIWIIATKNIKKGEELHYDYGYDMTDWQEHKCRCGKKSCIGYIVASNLRWRVKRKLSGK